LDDRVVEHCGHCGLQRLGHSMKTRIGLLVSRPRFARTGQQILPDGGVLGVALDHGQRMLGAVDADPERDQAHVLTKLHPVEHQRGQRGLGP
jgi:hypothetical protein